MHGTVARASGAACIKASLVGTGLLTCHVVKMAEVCAGPPYGSRTKDNPAHAAKSPKTGTTADMPADHSRQWRQKNERNRLSNEWQIVKSI